MMPDMTHIGISFRRHHHPAARSSHISLHNLRSRHAAGRHKRRNDSPVYNRRSVLTDFGISFLRGFARLRENADKTLSKPYLTRPGLILHIMHNLVYWIFLVQFVTGMSFRTGFVMYSIILLIRFVANTYITFGILPRQ